MTFLVASYPPRLFQLLKLRLLWNKELNVRFILCEIANRALPAGERRRVYGHTVTIDSYDVHHPETGVHRIYHLSLASENELKWSLFICSLAWGFLESLS